MELMDVTALDIPKVVEVGKVVWWLAAVHQSVAIGATKCRRILLVTG